MNAKDKKQYTPLHSAAAGGQSHAVKLLLELGADVSVSYAHMTCPYFNVVWGGVEGGPLEIPDKLCTGFINASPILPNHTPYTRPSLTHYIQPDAVNAHG